MHILRCFITAIMFLGAVHAQAQQFKSEKLRIAAQKLNVISRLDSLQPFQTLTLLAVDGLTVGVRTDGQAVVEHIGLPLFSEEMRTLIASPVYDFLEFAVLNKKYHFTENTLYLDRVIFTKGNWDSLLKMDYTKIAPPTITNRDNRYYIVTWENDGQTLLEVGMPIDYELLVNDTRRHLERQLVAELQMCPPPSVKTFVPVNEDELKLYGTEGLFVIQGESLILAELNQNRYYELKTIKESIDTIMWGKPERMVIEDVLPVAVVDSMHPAESLANLMLCDGLSVDSIMLTLDIHYSDYNRVELTLPVSRLRYFFQQQGCQLFFAFGGIYKEGALLRGMLFAANKAKGYNHLFSLQMPCAQLQMSVPKVKADVYLYIPNIDPSKLFSIPTSKKRESKKFRLQ